MPVILRIIKDFCSTCNYTCLLYTSYNQAVDEALADPTFYQGIVVEGIDLGGKTKEEAKVLLEEKELALRPNVAIKATYQDQVFALSLIHI